MVGDEGGHRIGLVDGDHDVPEDEASTGTQDAGDAGKEVSLVRTLQVVDGQGRDDDVERAGGQRVGQVGLL